MYKFFYNQLYKWRPPEMVNYWKRGDRTVAKVTEAPEGHLVMILQGEKYPFPGFPRGHILLSNFSTLKHNIKNWVFNENWQKLEDGEKLDVKTPLKKIIEYFKPMRFDMLPPNKMCPSVREIYRAWPTGNKDVEAVRDVLTFILQEDDGYRFRVQWLIKLWPTWLTKWRKSYVKDFEFALSMLEHAETIGDMKERIRLLRRILLEALKDPFIRHNFESFCLEVDWKKLKLSKADKYYLRGKYFRCDYPEYSY